MEAMAPKGEAGREGGQIRSADVNRQELQDKMDFKTHLVLR
jgi:hypothetical protein